MTKSGTSDLPFTPDNLLSLKEIEEILIAKAYIYVQIRQIKGQQFIYFGHTVNFMHYITKVYPKLPLLPSDLDIIILKPVLGSNNNNCAINQQLNRYVIFSERR